MIDIYTKAVNNQSASVKGKLSVYLTPLIIQLFQVGEHNKNPSRHSPMMDFIALFGFV